MSEIATWEDFEGAAPDLAAAVRARFEATKHHVLATLRSEGAPRVSGTEVEINGPELTLGSMHRARKAVDLVRDPRCALHANPGDGSMDGGDAKVSCVAREVTDPAEFAELTAGQPLPPEPFHLFALGIAEVVLTGIHPDGDRLEIRLWRPGEGERVFERA